MAEPSPLKCKCGSTLFLERQRVTGPWLALFDSSDPNETIETNLDNLTHYLPRRVECAQCGTKHPNPRRKDEA